LAGSFIAHLLGLRASLGGPLPPMFRRSESSRHGSTFRSKLRYDLLHGIGRRSAVIVPGALKREYSRVIVYSGDRQSALKARV